jgi:hypothetical protein
MKKQMIYLVAVFYCVLSVPALALVTYSFTGLTNNNAGSVAIGEAQLFLDVEDPGGDQVLFTFRNEGPEASSICDIYIEDGTYLSLDSIDNSDPGVSFSPGANPGNLPAGNTATPAFTASFASDSDPPVQLNGVNPGESVGFYFDLLGGKTVANITDALTNGEMRIGIHVQGFANGGSESFLLGNVVPAPSAIVLGSIGSLVVAGLRTLKNKKK